MVCFPCAFPVLSGTNLQGERGGWERGGWGGGRGEKLCKGKLPFHP